MTEVERKKVCCPGCGAVIMSYEKREGSRRGQNYEMFQLKEPCEYGNCRIYRCPGCNDVVGGTSWGPAGWPDCPHEEDAHLRFQDKRIVWPFNREEVGHWIWDVSQRGLDLFVYSVVSLLDDEEKTPWVRRRDNVLYKLARPLFVGNSIGYELYARATSPEFFQKTEVE